RHWQRQYRCRDVQESSAPAIDYWASCTACRARTMLGDWQGLHSSQSATCERLHRHLKVTRHSQGGEIVTNIVDTRLISRGTFSLNPGAAQKSQNQLVDTPVVHPNP